MDIFKRFMSKKLDAGAGKTYRVVRVSPGDQVEDILSGKTISPISRYSESADLILEHLRERTG